MGPTALGPRGLGMGAPPVLGGPTGFIGPRFMLAIWLFNCGAICIGGALKYNVIVGRLLDCYEFCDEMNNLW